MDGSTSDGASVTVARPLMSNTSEANNEGTTSRKSDSQFVIAQSRRNQDLNLPLNASNQEHAEESDYEEKILAVYWRAGKLGAAHYTLQTGELHVLDEIVDRPPSHQMLVNLYRRVEPVKLLLDGKMQSTFVSHVKRMIFDGASDDAGRCKLVFISNKDYNFEACKRRIYSLSLPYEPPGSSEDERAIFLRTVVNFSQTQTVHALGALLRYIDLNWSSISMDLHGKPQFMSLRKVSLADIVTIDEDTYKGLQIFSSVAHPSNFKKGVQGSNKEGLSLFSLFNRCSSKVGQSRMRVLFQHPTNDLATLKQRQDVVAFFMRGQNDTTMRNICSSLRFIKNVNGILAKIRALSAKPYQWKSLYNVLVVEEWCEARDVRPVQGRRSRGLRKAFETLSEIPASIKTLYNAVLICEMCENASDTSEFLDQLGSCDNNKLYEMALYMNRIIDFEASKTEGKFTVKPGVDPELDRKKQTMASLHTLMSETASVELERLPLFIEECTMLYMPHLGYLLGVKAWAEDLTMEQKELPNMRFMFQNNDYIHYKSKGCEELDVMIGDTYPEIVAHETKIMMRLTTIIMEHLYTLSAVIDKCAELDCLIAISKVSKELSFVRPELTCDKLIQIKQGRHPLHLVSCDNFVPNDMESTEDVGFVKILTGPNASGKSVYMKQIGLIVYLAHIGSFVPADSATIGVLTHIYTRIQSTECIAAHMSAFLIDLRQMALALQESTSKSLIIVDEFGKGTSEVDGIALLASCINSFLCREMQCPHVLLATHMLQLPEFLIKTPLVKLQRFEHMVQDGEPVFLFRLTDGSVDSSFAHQVAASCGIDTRVIERAGTVANAMMNNTLPPMNKKITAKLKKFTEMLKADLLRDD